MLTEHMDADWVAEMCVECMFVLGQLLVSSNIMIAMATITTTQYHRNNLWCDHHHDQDHYDDDLEHCHFHQSEPVVCLSGCV